MEFSWVKGSSGPVNKACDVILNSLWHILSLLSLSNPFRCDLCFGKIKSFLKYLFEIDFRVLTGNDG